jgi:glycosyltransferase involved in cell wall biosynthesis
MPEDHRMPLRVCLLSYRSNPHCGGQGVYVRNLSRALRELGHRVDVISGPPLPVLDDGVGLIYLPGLDLYNPDDLFRTPSLVELADPVNLLEWLGVSTMGFPEPLTFGIRAFRFLKHRLDHYDILHDNQSLSYGVWAIKNRVPAIATIHHPITVDRDVAVRSVRFWWKKLKLLRWYSFIGMQIRVARKFSRVITVSERTRADILGLGRDDAALVRLYHRLLVWDLMHHPRAVRLLERLLNPVLGKSIVLYGRKRTRPDSAVP